MTAELEADAFAVDMVIRAGAAAGLSHAEFLTGGILAVLVIAGAVEDLSTYEDIRSPAANTHPALDERWTHLVAHLERQLPSARPDRRAEIFFGWLIGLHLPAIMGWFDRVAEVIKRPGRWD